MEYFVFDDNFEHDHYEILKSHLKPYRMRKSPLPFENKIIPRFWNSSKKFIILVPSSSVSKYEHLRSENVNVFPYKS
jgi:hypothetical protein